MDHHPALSFACTQKNLIGTFWEATVGACWPFAPHRPKWILHAANRSVLSSSSSLGRVMAGVVGHLMLMRTNGPPILATMLAYPFTRGTRLSPLFYQRIENLELCQLLNGTGASDRLLIAVEPQFSLLKTTTRQYYKCTL